jgi:hypothetical protein
MARNISITIIPRLEKCCLMMENSAASSFKNKLQYIKIHISLYTATAPFADSLIGNLMEHRAVLTRLKLLNIHFNALFTSLNFIVFGIYT